MDRWEERGSGKERWMDLSGCKSKYEMVDLLPIRIVKSNVLRVGPLSERNNISE